MPFLVASIDVFLQNVKHNALLFQKAQHNQSIWYHYILLSYLKAINAYKLLSHFLQ